MTTTTTTDFLTLSLNATACRKAREEVAATGTLDHTNYTLAEWRAVEPVIEELARSRGWRKFPPVAVEGR